MLRKGLSRAGLRRAATLVAVVGVVSAGAVPAHAAGPAAPPANDNFAQAEVLAHLNGTVTRTNDGATAETGEPAHAGNTASASIWFRFVPSTTGMSTVDTCGSDFDTVLAVYTGTAVSALHLIASNDDANDPDCTTQSRVTFTATAGVSYSIAVDGFGGDTGSVQLSWARLPPPPANDNFANATAIGGATGTLHGANTNATTEAGEPPIGPPTGHTVWYRFTPIAAGVLSVDTCGSTFDTVLATYTGASLGALTPVVSNDDSCDVQSAVATAVVKGVPLQIVIAGFDTNAGQYTLHWSFVPGGLAGPPTLTGVTGGDGWASVTWVPPVFKGTSTITSYRITNTLGTSPTTVAAATSAAVVTGLTNGKSYQFLVSPINASGVGVASQLSLPIKPTAGSVDITSRYSAGDDARLLKNAAYFGTDAQDAQRNSVGIVAYIVGLVGGAPTPVAAPPSSGPNVHTTTWSTADQAALVTVMRRYGLGPSDAQYFSVGLIGYLLGLGGH